MVKGFENEKIEEADDYENERQNELDNIIKEISILKWISCLQNESIVYIKYFITW